MLALYEAESSSSGEARKPGCGKGCYGMMENGEGSEASRSLTQGQRFMRRGRGAEIDVDKCVPKWNFLKVVKVHEVKCALRARLEYICFSGVCVCVVVGGGKVNWSGGLGGARAMFK